MESETINIAAHPLSHQVRVWYEFLDYQAPIFGRLIQYIAVRRLYRFMRRGVPLAAYSLASLLDRHPEPGIQELAEKYLLRSKKISVACLNALWEAWNQLRSPKLASILIDNKLPATKPAYNLIISTLLLQQNQPIQFTSPALINALTQACSDRDHRISNAAQKSASSS